MAEEILVLSKHFRNLVEKVNARTLRMSKDLTLIPPERIERSIFLIRGLKVMLSTNLAELYQVEPRALVQAVKRNMDRFPRDFMFQLNKEEFSNLKSQIVISSWGGLRRALAGQHGRVRSESTLTGGGVEVVLCS